jgi:hypothetical protein
MRLATVPYLSHIKEVFAYRPNFLRPILMLSTRLCLDVQNIIFSSAFQIKT